MQEDCVAVLEIGGWGLIDPPLAPSRNLAAGTEAAAVEAGPGLGQSQQNIGSSASNLDSVGRQQGGCSIICELQSMLVHSCSSSPQAAAASNESIDHVFASDDSIVSNGLSLDPLCSSLEMQFDDPAPFDQQDSGGRLSTSRTAADSGRRLSTSRTPPASYSIFPQLVPEPNYGPLDELMLQPQADISDDIGGQKRINPHDGPGKYRRRRLADRPQNPNHGDPEHSLGGEDAGGGGLSGPASPPPAPGSVAASGQCPLRLIPPCLLRTKAPVAAFNGQRRVTGNC